MTEDDTAHDLPSHEASSVETSTRPLQAVPGQEEPEARRLSLLPLSLLALIVGAITGLGAVAFRGLIGLVHNIMFLGHVSSP
jgi:CIC family chloride channel protein